MKFKFLSRNTNKNRSKTVFVNDIDDINVINDINDVNDFVNNFVNKPPKPILSKIMKLSIKMRI